MVLQFTSFSEHFYSLPLKHESQSQTHSLTRTNISPTCQPVCREIETGAHHATRICVYSNVYMCILECLDTLAVNVCVCVNEILVVCACVNVTCTNMQEYVYVRVCVYAFV